MPNALDVENALRGLTEANRSGGAVNWQNFFTQAAKYAADNNIDPNLLAQAGQKIAPTNNWDLNKVQQTTAQYSPTATNYGQPAAPDNAVKNQLLGIQNSFRDPATGKVDWPSAFKAMTQYATQNNIDPTVLAQVGQQIAPTNNWDINKVQQTMSQYGPRPTDYGLAASYDTLNQGGADATRRIGQTQQNVDNLYRQGLQMLQPYQQTGNQANQLQAALSGALGPEAQKQAFAQYENSPGVKWAQQQGEQSILRNASAGLGLGGGNTLKALQAFGTGLAMQDYGNQFSRLGDIATRGYGAATTGASLQGQQAGVQSGLGQFSANIPLQTASQLGGLQYQAGRDISSNIATTTSSLANLINQQGAGMADITGDQATNINALYQAALNGDAQAKEQLATLLGNLSVQGSSQYAGQPIIQPQPSNLLGQLGQAASGIGGLIYGAGQYGRTSTGVNSAANTNPGYGPSYNTPYKPVYQ